MPDNDLPPLAAEIAEDWKTSVPPVLMVLGAISLFRTSRILSLALGGAFLYDLARAHDDARRTKPLRHSSRRAKEARIDEALEESFPASDPPAY